MLNHPQRTCIGCRKGLPKGDVVRIVAGPLGAVIDYRGKLPGRGAYVCPSPECIKKAVSKGSISRALKTRTSVPQPDEFIRMLIAAVTEKMESLLTMAARAGMLKPGYSAVRDSIEKQKALLVIFASDISDGTRERLMPLIFETAAVHTIPFSKDDMGRLIGREAVGVVAVEDEGFADAIRKEIVRLKTLRNAGH